MSKHRCTKVQHVPQENWFISSNEGTCENINFIPPKGKAIIFTFLRRWLCNKRCKDASKKIFLTSEQNYREKYVLLGASTHEHSVARHAHVF